MPVVVSLEGNIGAGKSTMLQNLQQKVINSNKKWVFLKEPVDIWAEIKDAQGETILSKFYADSKKYAFAFQIMAYTTRLHLIRKLLQENPECEVVICERSLDADKHIFAKMLHDDGLIEDVMYDIYSRYFSEYAEDFNLDAVVYIDSSAETCHARVSKRAREGESVIALDYLKRCREYHESWLLNQDVAIDVLHLDTNSEATFTADDIVGNKWLNDIVEFLEMIAFKKNIEHVDVE